MKVLSLFSHDLLIMIIDNTSVVFAFGIVNAYIIIGNIKICILREQAIVHAVVISLFIWLKNVMCDDNNIVYFLLHSNYAVKVLT